METIAPEHGFWNGQAPVSGVPGDDLVSVRFLERLQAGCPIVMAERGS